MSPRRRWPGALLGAAAVLAAGLAWPWPAVDHAPAGSIRGAAASTIRLRPPTVPVPAPVLDWRLNEGTGNTATDSSGNGLSGTISGTPTWGSGWVRVQGPGTVVITRALTGLPTGTSARTLCVWASEWAGTGAGELAGLGNNSNPIRRLGVYRRVGGLISADAWAVGYAAAAHTDWTGLHLYCVAAPSGGALAALRVSVDGQERAAAVTRNAADPLSIGGGEFAVGRIPTVINVEGADARIHGVVVWAQDLSPAQLAAVFAAGAK